MSKEADANRARQAAFDKAQQAAVGGVRRHGIFRRCPACGADQETMQKRWCPGAMKLATEGPCRTEGQHLHGQCGSCGFPWKEQTANADEIGEKASPITEK